MSSPQPARSEILRESNRRLSCYLENILAAPGQLLITPDQMGVLLSELLRVGSDLRSHPLPTAGSDPAWDTELAAYRGNVERLRDLLPSIHDQLLAERARIEKQRARIRAAAEWARASRQTL